MSKNKNKKIYWLVGDRFVCIERKKDIVRCLQKENNWISENINTISNADEFFSNVLLRDLFGSENKICICDGPIPEPKKSVDVIANLPDNRKLIIIEDKIDKRTVMYKRYSSDIEEYPQVIKPGSLFGIDYTKIESAKKIIKKIVNWSGADETFNAIFSACDYDYGRTINEINKILIYTEGRYPKDISEIYSILSSPRRPEVNRLVDAVNNRNAVESFQILNNLYDVMDFATSEGPMDIISVILESHIFMLYCKMANDSGYFLPQEVGEYVSKIMKKKGENINSVSASKRYYFYRDCVKKRKLEDISKSISKIESAYKNVIIRKFNSRYIINKLIFEII